MNWKQSLDRYLTSAPDDGFTDYCESVTELFTDAFYDENESWIIDETEQIDKWLSKLFNKGIDHKQAAMIIERAFTFYSL